MKIILILFSLFYVIFQPAAGYFFFKRFLKRLAEDPGFKLLYYKNSLLCSWLPVGIIAAVLLFGGVPVSRVGIGWIVLDSGKFGKWATAGILLAFALVFFLYAFQIVMARVNEPYRNKLAETKVPEEIALLLPHTPEEKKYWTLVATTAGLVEEIVYRGFLLFLLSSLFPDLPVFWCILISSALFGLAHTYQGLSGILKTGAVGLLFALVYACTGSLLPGILLHFIMDYAAKNVGTGNDVQAAG